MRSYDVNYANNTVIMKSIIENYKILQKNIRMHAAFNRNSSRSSLLRRIDDNVVQIYLSILVFEVSICTAFISFKFFDKEIIGKCFSLCNNTT